MNYEIESWEIIALVLFGLLMPVAIPAVVADDPRRRHRVRRLFSGARKASYAV